VQYCVQQLCTVRCTHTWTHLTVLWIGFCLTGPISLCLDSFLYGVLLCAVCMCRFVTRWGGPGGIEACPYILQCFDTVGWVIWPEKTVPEMTYNVFSGILNPQSKLSDHASPQPKQHLQSVQPSMHRRPRSVSIVYNGLPVSKSKLPLPMLTSGPHVIRGSLGPPDSGTQMVTWSFQPFLQGSLVWHTDRATERGTDRPRYSVQCDVIMRNYVGYGKANNFATINLLSRHVYVQNI